jgi:hypothetical protein
LIFSEPYLENLSLLRQSQERRALLAEIFSSFNSIFPTIDFQLIDDSGVINAQAIVVGGQRCVRLYGGLAFHPLAGRGSLSFGLLHEIGHHLARGCRLPSDLHLACDCAADHWAATIGAQSVSGVMNFNLQSALDEMDLIFEKHDEALGARQYKCWALTWSYRKQSILAKRLVNWKTCRLPESLSYIGY